LRDALVTKNPPNHFPHPFSRHQKIEPARWLDTLHRKLEIMFQAVRPVIGRKVSYCQFVKKCHIIIVSVFKVWIAFLLVF